MDILNDLAAGEDEFDVDLMAAGCRIAISASVDEIAPAELVRLYDFDRDDLVQVLEQLVKDSTVGMAKLYTVAEDVVSRKPTA